MRANIQDALLSVGEVAAFVWSLLELLLTRILPLTGFLVGHLLLQWGRLLVYVVISAAGPHGEGRHAENSGELQTEEIIEGDDALRQLRKRADYYENDVDDLQGSDKLDDEDGDLAADTAADHEVHVVDLKPSDEDVFKSGAVAAANEVQVRGRDAGNVADVVANEMQLRGDRHGHVAETEPSSVDVAGGENRLASPNEEGSGGKMDLEPLEPSSVEVAGGENGHASPNGERSGGKMDWKPSGTSRSSTRSSEEARSASGGGEMRKSRKMIGVLPPSFSQIRRTLMQTSRRGLPSPQSISPSTRKRASVAGKSSPSHDHLMSKFRKHFLLDRA